MALTRVKATSREDITSAISAAPSGTRIVLLFCGAKDAAGVSWCSDCVAAEHTLDTSFAAAAATRPLLVVDVPLARADFKGVSSHWARAAPFNVGKVPALCRWGATKVTAALFEEECMDADGVATFLDECK